MATGIETKLTGQIGEHLVSAILGTKGYYASPYSGNVPGFDITAVQSESLKSFPLQVKTSTNGSLIQSQIDKWCEHSLDKNNFQKLGNLKKLKHPDMIWVIVRLANENIANSSFFLCREAQIQEKIVNRYREFMERHDYRRPNGGGSKQAVLDIKDLIEFKDNWKILEAVQ
jgi:hypothetical protein